MAKSACWSLWPTPNSKTGWLLVAGAEANATTAAGSDGTHTAARPTGRTDEAVAGATATTSAEAGIDAAGSDTEAWLPGAAVPYFLLWLMWLPGDGLPSEPSSDAAADSDDDHAPHNRCTEMELLLASV